MSRHFLLTASCAWVALMGIVWALFVPKGLSVGTFTMLSMSGPLVLVAISMFRFVQGPATRAGQAPVGAVAAKAIAPARG